MPDTADLEGRCKLIASGLDAILRTSRRLTR
jgi:hypothetical protein